MNPLKMYFLLKLGILHCYVSLTEGSPKIHVFFADIPLNDHHFLGEPVPGPPKHPCLVFSGFCEHLPGFERRASASLYGETGAPNDRNEACLIHNL